MKTYILAVHEEKKPFKDLCNVHIKSIHDQDRRNTRYVIANLYEKKISFIFNLPFLD